MMKIMFPGFLTFQHDLLRSSPPFLPQLHVAVPLFLPVFIEKENHVQPPLLAFQKRMLLVVQVHVEATPSRHRMKASAVDHRVVVEGLAKLEQRREQRRNFRVRQRVEVLPQVLSVGVEPVMQVLDFQRIRVHEPNARVVGRVVGQHLLEKLVVQEVLQNHVARRRRSSFRPLCLLILFCLLIVPQLLLHGVQIPDPRPENLILQPLFLFRLQRFAFRRPQRGIRSDSRKYSSNIFTAEQKRLIFTSVG
mmetsp:Transcript_1857/g.4282  ORF Transcript_1857/g.4282 Transcript_1857/m.4282 type:complete len:249 (+) Transcript_1857:841-1587(+)